MRPSSAMALAAAALALLLRAPAAAVIDPHHDADSCLSCHPQAPPPGARDVEFLAGDIDETCLVCHRNECCTIARPHESTHPSGISHWDKRRFGEPERLPLQDGQITCVTCHFWRRDNNPLAEDYKLLRIVRILPTRVDWTLLCQDCHEDY